MNSATKVWPCHVVSAASQSQAVEIALVISSNSWCMTLCNCEVLLQERSSCFVAARQAGVGVAGAREGGRAAEEVVSSSSSSSSSSRSSSSSSSSSKSQLEGSTYIVCIHNMQSEKEYT